jgi:hypothetical protein
MIVLGPIVSLADPATDQTETWPPENQQRWAPEVTDALVERLNRADAQEHRAAGAEEPPLVTPPLYGGTHRQQPRIQTPPEVVDQPEWFRQLNLDPRHRIVGGLGTRVVQAEQESLMASAWNQVIGVEAANRALRLAQLARRVGAVLHRRHLERLSESAVISATERVHAKLLADPAATVWSTLAASTLPPAVTTGAFRRLLRSRGPVVMAAAPTITAADRIDAVESLAVRSEDQLTTDWVLRYLAPDGVGRLSGAARARISEDITAQIAPGVDREALLRQWREALDRPGPETVVGPEAVGRAPFTSVDLGARVLPGTLAQLLAALPDRRQMTEDPEEAAAGAALVAQIVVLAGLAMRRRIATIPVSLRDVRRLDLPIEDRDERSALVPTEPLFGWARQMLDEVRRFFPDLPLPDVEAQAGRLAELIDRTLTIEGPELARGFARLADRLVVDDAFAEPDRARIEVPALRLKAKLDPRITIPARIDARLTGGTGRLPAWLSPTWFADRRVEPVMAHPRFDHPMYEPLDRYPRDWMIPGLGKIKRPDMSTLLRTNNTFVEAYLVGLNHEMGRELLWREYPTDQRGTYFRSFWTGAPELVADLHEPEWSTGELRTHLTLPDGRIVLLVRGDLIRRYPGVLAHAVRQAQQPPEGLLTDQGVPLFEVAGPDQPVRTLFRIVLPPNILLVGFDLEVTQIESDLVEWWFTLSENPTEPRFGLDVPSVPPVAEPRGREDLQWTDFGVEFDQFLQAGVGAVAFSGDLGEEIRWGTTSAQIAALLFQLPARAAYNGKRMIAAVG